MARNGENVVENKEMKKDKKKSGAFLWMIGTASLAVAILIACQFFFMDDMSEKTFLDNTKINGVDVSGLTEKQAENVVARPES